MGQSILRSIVELLNDKGLPAEPAQPTAIMSSIHAPVAAVSLEKADRESKTVTLLVEIVAPLVAGALQCQHKALDVCEILTQEGAVCAQGECTFDNHLGMFITPVKAVFSGVSLSNDWIPTVSNAVAINDRNLPYCVSVTAEKKVTEVRPTLAEVNWTITVEEFIPAGTAEPEELDGTFAVRISSQGKEEVYASCTMTQIRRIVTPEGIRQIRTATTSRRLLE